MRQGNGFLINLAMQGTDSTIAQLTAALSREARRCLDDVMPAVNAKLFIITRRSIRRVLTIVCDRLDVVDVNSLTSTCSSCTASCTRPPLGGVPALIGRVVTRAVMPSASSRSVFTDL